MTDEEIAEHFAQTTSTGNRHCVSVIVFSKGNGFICDAYGVVDSEESLQMAFNWLDRCYPGIENHVHIT